MKTTTVRAVDSWQVNVYVQRSLLPKPIAEAYCATQLFQIDVSFITN